MIPLGVILALASALNEKPSFDYQTARTHEIKPHRRTIPHEGVKGGFNQLRLTLTISPNGEVIDAKASGDPEWMKLWPELESEVRGWKFTPFERNGKAITAEVEEYIDLVPPQRLPKVHVAPPIIRPDSKVVITLERSGCYGSCGAYGVTLANDGIVFEGRGFVVAQGRHTTDVDKTQLRSLAQYFVAADFYSMDSEYAAGVTDMPAYVLCIAIDGQTKKILDYVGAWVGMPSVITQLEDEVDGFANTGRWVEGTSGLVQALKAEKFDFRTFEAQFMLKQAASRGQTATVREFLESGVPLKPLSVPKSNAPFMAVAFTHVGLLNAASSHPMPPKQGGSILIYASESGNPMMVAEILRYRPDLEARDREGKTAVFAAGHYRDGDSEGARVECLRLLAKAGANVNARDKDGDTALHETFLTDVEEELLKLGANVNARNKDGETPIFTTVDNDALALFIAHGADLNVRNKKGQTVLEAAKEKGPVRQEALRKAIQNAGKR